MSEWRFYNTAELNGVELRVRVRVKEGTFRPIIKSYAEIQPYRWGTVTVTAPRQWVDMKFYCSNDKKMPGTSECEIKVNDYGVTTPELFWKIECDSSGMAVLSLLDQDPERRGKI